MTTEESAMSFLATLQNGPPSVDESMMDIGGEEVYPMPNPNIISTSGGTLDLSQLDLTGGFTDFTPVNIMEPCTEESMQQIAVDTNQGSLSLYQPMTVLHQDQMYGNNMVQMETENKDVTFQRVGQVSPVQTKKEKLNNLKGEASVIEELQAEVTQHFGKYPEKIPPVKVLRYIIPKMLMCCYDNLNQKKVKGLWTDKKPEDWPENIPFKDPNNKAKGDGNQKPRREDLEAMYTHLKNRLTGTGTQQYDSTMNQGVSVQPHSPQYPVQVEDTGHSNGGQDEDQVMPGKELVERIQSKMEFVEKNAGSLVKIFKDLSQHVMKFGEKGQENMQFIRYGHNFELLLDCYRLNKNIPDPQDISSLFPEIPLSIQAEDYGRPSAEVQCTQEVSVKEYSVLVQGTGETKLRDAPPTSPETFEEVGLPDMKVMMRQPAEQSSTIDADYLDLLKELGIQEHVFSGEHEDYDPVKAVQVKLEGEKFSDCELKIEREVNIEDLMAVISKEMPNIKQEINEDYEINQKPTNSQTEQEDVQVAAMSPGQVLSPGMADVTAQYDNMQIKSPTSEIHQAPHSPAKRKLENFNNNTTQNNQPQVHVVQDQSEVSKNLMFFQRMAQRQDQQVFVFGEPGTQGQIPPMVAQLSDDEPAPQPCKKMRI